MLFREGEITRFLRTSIPLRGKSYWGDGDFSTNMPHAKACWFGNWFYAINQKSIAWGFNPMKKEKFPLII